MSLQSWKPRFFSIPEGSCHSQLTTNIVVTEAIPVISGDHRLQNYFMLICQVYGFDCVTLRKLLIQASSLAQQSEREHQHWPKLWSLHLVMVQHVTFEKFPGPENFVTTGLPSVRLPQ